MSSKSGDRPDKGALPSRSGRAWSLTIWLTLVNALASFLILALISALLYTGLASLLRNEYRLYLRDELRTIETLTRDRRHEQRLLREIGTDQSSPEYVKHFVRLMDRNASTLMETSGMAQAVPAGAFPIPARGIKFGPDGNWRAPDGNLIISAMVWVDLGAGGDRGILQVALDVTNVESLLAEYRRKIYLSLVLGLMLCVLASLAVARRGTRPLLEMTEIIRGVTVSNLKERIAGENWLKELNQLADAMNLMLDRLQDSFSRLFNSATNLTHKMRTPLTILRGEAEVALSRDRSVEELQQVIVSSLEENTRLSRLGDNIFFLANADMGKYQLSPTLFDAREEADNVIDFYAPAAEVRGVEITCHGSAVLTADAPLYRKALAALLANGYTYNKPGGKVDVCLSQGEDGSCLLRVTDNGCGMDSSEMDKIFDRFYRIYATRYADPHGTGLGLPIAKAIMELHGGTITVESRLEEGTTVTLSFPPKNA